MTDDELLVEYERHMRTARFSPKTIEARLELLRRLSRFLVVGLVAASPVDLERFQQSFVHLSRGSNDIYARHVLALYRWLLDTDRLSVDPTRRMVRIKARRGLPHPILEADLRMLLACAPGGLRLAYVFAAFAGLRAGEITRMRAEDLSLDLVQPVAYVQGKGGRDRIVPLLPPIVAELRKIGLPRRGPVVLRLSGSPYTPDQLSIESCRFMKELGIASTLHSLRHYFASEVVKLTHDVLLTRDLLGHASLATTQIYMSSSIDGAQDRLAGLSDHAQELMGNR